MKTIQFIYKENTVDFQSPGNENVMVNATQMAKIFDKQVIAFLRNDDTKNFISECLKSENSHFISVKNEEDLVVSRQKTGTWMHRILALKFAAWLNPQFELWVFATIDKIILGAYAEHREATIEQIKTMKNLQKKRDELLHKYPEFEDFIELENKLSMTEKRRMKAMRDTMKQLRLEFQ